MNRMIYQVCIGNESNSALYQFCMDSVARYCERHGITHIVQGQPKLKIKPDVKATNRSKESYEKHGGYLPIYEKENAFEYIDEYDQIAIIDADIYARESAPNVFDEFGNDYAFGAVIEREMPITDQYRKKIVAYSKGQYSRLSDVDWKWNSSFGAEFANMGMIVFNSQQIKQHLKGQTPEQFIRRKEFKRFVDGLGNWKWSTDQTLLNWWIKKEQIPFKHLDWKWNALYRGIENKYIPEAHFIHFFLKDHLPNRGEDIKQLKRILSV